MPTDHGFYALVSDYSSFASNNSLAYGPEPHADGSLPLPVLKRTLLDNKCTNMAYATIWLGYNEAVNAVKIPSLPLFQCAGVLNDMSLSHSLRE
jgi:hypothetical protein